MITPASLAEKVIAWSSLRVTVGESDYDSLLMVAEAVVAYVSTLPVVVDLPSGEPLPPSVELGMVMLASRMYRRKNSPTGIDSVTADGVTYVTRYDSDIASMLRLDSPQVG